MTLLTMLLMRSIWESEKRRTNHKRIVPDGYDPHADKPYANIGVSASTKKGFVGRIPMIEAVVKRAPGFDTRLRKKRPDGQRRVYTTVDPKMFEANEEHLLGILREAIPQHGFGEPMHAAKHTAVAKLHKWMVDELVYEGEHGKWRGQQ